MFYGKYWILKECPGIKAASVYVPLCVEKEFDFSPLYEMENLEAVDCGAESLAGAPRVNKFFVDFTKMKHIKQIRISLSNFRRGTGFQKVKDLELLRISDCDKEDLREYFCSEKMKYLMIFLFKASKFRPYRNSPQLKMGSTGRIKKVGRYFGTRTYSRICWGALYQWMPEGERFLLYWKNW